MSKYSRNTFKTLQENRLAPKKRFGQNFLVHQQTADSIVRACKLDKEETVVEVGVGLGALTIPLAQKAKKIIGYEIDSGIVRYHEENADFPENVTLIHQDILKADFKELSIRCGGKIRLVANLPYSISNPFIFALIENVRFVSKATIMLQKEVADRLTAEPGSKSYGIPTVLLGRCANVTRLLTLKPSQFHPRPKVDSVVVDITFIDEADQTEKYNIALFTRVVRTTFNQRRKTIINTLNKANLFGNHQANAREKILFAINKAGLQPELRPETLSVLDFVRLTIELTEVLEA